MKTFYITLCIVLFAGVINAQEGQKPLITKRTATWCPNCGTWGWSFFKDIIDETEGDALVFATHFSGNLMDPLNEDIANAFGGSGQPQFFVNGINVGANANNNADKLEQVKTDVSDINNIESEVTVNVTGAYSVLDDDNINFSADVQVTPTGAFLNDGVYTVGVYLLRDDVNIAQAGIGGGPVDHFKILSGTFTGDSFGMNMPDSGLDQSFSLNYTSDVDVERCQIGIVVWKNLAGGYSVVTTGKNDSPISLLSSNVDIDESSFEWYQEDSGDLIIRGPKNIDQVNLLDVSGKVWNSQNVDNPQAVINTNNVIPGIYILQIRSKDALESHKVLIK